MAFTGCSEKSAMKIDVYCHIFPPKFYERMLTLPEKSSTIKKRVREIPSIVNLEVRFRMMDQFGDYVQGLTLPAPPIESLGDPEQSPGLAEVANDVLAELRIQHP